MHEINVIDSIFLDTMRSISLLAGISIIISIFNVLFWVFTVVYVYKDSKDRGLNTILWTSTTVFAPYYLGFLTYLIVNYNSRGYNKEEYEFQNKVTNNNIKIDKENIVGYLKKILVIITLIIILLVGAMLSIKGICKGIENYENKVYGEVFKTENIFKSSYLDFNSSEEAEIRYHEDGNLKINYKSKVKKGSLRMGLYKYNGEPVRTFYTNEKGSISLPIKKDTIYRLIATGENTKGYYEVDWEFEPEE